MEMSKSYTSSPNGNVLERLSRTRSDIVGELGFSEDLLSPFSTSMTMCSTLFVRKKAFREPL